ncbi:hypothetical protein B0A77_01085 [Flavobacterium branchiophilum]|uniref:Acyl esterase n=2 Tax=Flavobacterium branchiophilum TaxID=55197 RepID=A0A2H3KEQ8_9FLAO|nr:hypothetical protein B0A77_01085 [Flavobacterium branchiophilum]
MQQNMIETQVINKEKTYKYDFSICTLVTKNSEYLEMMHSFIAKGFTKDNSEFLKIDNTQGCTFDAYQGLNRFLQEAQGKYVILCHQDIILHDHDIQYLHQLIDEIDVKDKNWAILSNAGGINLKWIATHITQGNGRIITEKYLPLKVKTVDENFILVKNAANLSLSNNLSGFHFYGTDICLIADVLGFTSYVIGFNLIHKSNGKIDDSFYKSLKNIKQKYKFAFRNRFITTTFSRIYFSGTSFLFLLNNSSLVLFLVRQYYKFFTKKKDYSV